MKTKTIEFTDLEKKVSEKGKSFRDVLATEMGKAYVIVISRDGCPACETQKPRFDELAENFSSDKAVFMRIPVRFSKDYREEALRSKDVLQHYFFPTNIILVKTRDEGAIELYRSVEPRMNEVKRNVKLAIDIAAMLAKR